MDAATTRRGQTGRRAVAALAVIGCLGIGWWAGRATLVAPQAEKETAAQRVEITVAEASVGRTVTYNATVRQPFEPVASNALAGVVTRVVPHDVVGVGDELFAVDGTAVRVVLGDTPFWRDLTSGVSGPDVAQLQRALVTLGYFQGRDDGKFTAATGRAVRAWQKATGHEQTGAVLHGAARCRPDAACAGRPRRGRAHGSRGVR